MNTCMVASHITNYVVARPMTNCRVATLVYSYRMAMVMANCIVAKDKTIIWAHDHSMLGGQITNCMLNTEAHDNSILIL
jgi:hypothetical protein